MSFRELLRQSEAHLAPAVFNPLTAKLAEAAGFRMLYLGGGTLGYVNCCLEANLDITGMAQAGLAIRAVTSLPLILDGACGFGDPMHMHHVIPTAEAAGFSAIEIEDQLLPKRAHHHVGIEHMIPRELMAAKVREAVRVRRSEDFLIISRTNGVRASNMDDALRRAEAYRAAGADAIYLTPRSPEEFRQAGERLPPPLMTSLQGESVADTGLTSDELARLGFRILTVNTPAFAFHHAMQLTYDAIAQEQPNPVMGGTGRKAAQEALHRTIELEALLAVERATVEK
jgi:2-methylisocitrate lyase-like PEP mutase family enzyme